MDFSKNLISQVLVSPESFLNSSPQRWDLIVRQGRRSMLLPRLCHLLGVRNLLDKVPVTPRQHLLSDYRYAEKLQVSVQWEVRCIVEALGPLDIPILFLKGAAYVIAADDASSGRLFSDIDVLVPKHSIDQVEQALKAQGWVGTHQNDYDQRYYRNWMHELPPMIHLKRQTTLDVHYNILPEVGRICPDAAKLVNQAVRLEDARIGVLCPEDRVIHSSAHLFHDGEFDHGSRDLSDIDLLCRQYSRMPSFWARLCDRALELGLQRSLFYALRYTPIFYRTPIPDEIVERLRISGPHTLTLKLLDALFLRALMPDHASCNDYLTGIARWSLFVRAHWLRMPPRLLIRHLLKKAQVRWDSRGHLK